MIEKLMVVERKTVFINLFNIENNATKEDIFKFYEGIKIVNIIQNVGKQGNYDLMFDSKEEAIKLINKGPGVMNFYQFFSKFF
jgi:hypothetical protein